MAYLTKGKPVSKWLPDVRLVVLGLKAQVMEAMRDHIHTPIKRSAKP